MERQGDGEHQAVGICYGMVWYMARSFCWGDWLGLVHMAAFWFGKVWYDYLTSSSYYGF